MWYLSTAVPAAQSHNTIKDENRAKTHTSKWPYVKIIKKRIYYNPQMAHSEPEIQKYAQHHTEVAFFAKLCYY